MLSSVTQGLQKQCKQTTIESSAPPNVGDRSPFEILRLLEGGTPPEITPLAIVEIVKENTIKLICVCHMFLLCFVPLFRSIITYEKGQKEALLGELLDFLKVALN